MQTDLSFEYLAELEENLDLIEAQPLLSVPY